MAIKTQTLMVRKTLDHRFIEGNQAWIKAANFDAKKDFTGLTDFDTCWAEFSEITHAHERDAIAGLAYAAIHFGVVENYRPAWIHNYKYLDEVSSIETPFIQVIAHEITKPYWVDYLNRLYHDNRFNIKQFYIGKPTQESLTENEQLLLFLLLRGKTAKEVAIFLNRSHRTIEDRIFKLKQKLNCRNRSQLIEYAFNQGYAEVLPLSCSDWGLS